MSSFVYSSYKMNRNQGAGQNLLTGVVKCALVSSAYIPNQDTHAFFSDITNEVAAVGGYTAGGQALTTKTLTLDTTAHAAVFDADDVQWDPSTIAARAAVLYVDTGNPATSPLIAYEDFISDKSSSNDRFKVAWAATGIMRDA
jgi:hypothetical protein